jgi:uncharacterized protein YbbC (DUF1343 family)
MASTTSVRTGLDLLLAEPKRLAGKRIALAANPSSVDSQLRFIVDTFSREKSWNLVALFGPEHGLRADQQDQVLCDSHTDSLTGLPVHSLYGKQLAPTREMLTGIDSIVFDIQDVGSRYYTFVYTLSHIMEACRDAAISVVVLDRPNPINGADLEGPVLQSGFESFVGRYPLPIRHGMTVGELALYFNKEMRIECNLNVIAMQGWKREMFFEETRLPWVMPSPNMPTVDTAMVYPGMCLFEGTNVSEGRGTTRPFEIFGAPWIDPYVLCKVMERFALPGVVLRPLFFTPTFNKYRGELCGGAQIHVTNRRSFRPVKTALCLLSVLRGSFGKKFAWKEPPYEFVTDRLPIDILFGNSWVREGIDRGEDPNAIEAKWRDGLNKMAEARKPYLLY